MYTKPIIMLDFETSGGSPAEGARITEVAALRIVGDTVVDRYVSLVNARVHIPYFITELTGITQAMVNRAPPVEEVVPQLIDFIGDASLSAHNASFDEKFLLAESALCGLRSGHQGVICSVKLARRVFPGLPSYALGNLSRSLKIRFQGAAHRAEADAEVSAKLLLQIGAALQDRYAFDTIDPALLEKINRLPAVKVHAFLTAHAKTVQTEPTEEN